MKISEMLGERRNQLGKTWKELEREYGFSEGTLRRMARGQVTLNMHADTLQKFCDLLQVRPVTVILAQAEEAGIYDPDIDGTLSHRGLPAPLIKALQSLHKEVNLYLGEPAHA